MARRTADMGGVPLMMHITDSPIPLPELLAHVLSPNFLNNPGWTKVEFNSVFTRESIEKEDFILPVWVDVTKEQVFEYCPTLVDRRGAQWHRGLDAVVRELYRAIFPA
jgi:hypothetical protein